jgi:hypothetical protein
MITAAAFSADGTRAVAGSYRGRLRFYEVEAEGQSPTFEYVTQVRLPSAVPHPAEARHRAQGGA